MMMIIIRTPRLPEQMHENIFWIFSIFFDFWDCLGTAATSTTTTTPHLTNKLRFTEEGVRLLFLTRWGHAHTNAHTYTHTHTYNHTTTWFLSLTYCADGRAVELHWLASASQETYPKFVPKFVPKLFPKSFRKLWGLNPKSSIYNGFWR